MGAGGRGPAGTDPEDRRGQPAWVKGEWVLEEGRDGTPKHRKARGEGWFGLGGLREVVGEVGWREGKAGPGGN